MASNNPGDYQLSELMLEGEDYKTNFTSMLFQEHIFSPFVRGNVRVNQFEGKQSKFDGTALSSIVFNTPEGDKRRYSKLMTNGISDIMPAEGNRSRSFTVDLVSKHAVTNNSTPNYQKSFKNRQISDIVQSVLNDGLGIDLPMNIDSTRGMHGSDYQPIILTQKSPLRHIDDLRRMAVSGQNYDGFLLFSGIGESGGEEIFFKSIYDMVKQDSVARITNFRTQEMNQTLKSTNMNNVIEMWFPKQTSALEKAASFSRGTTKFDMNKLTADVARTETGKARQQTGSGTSLNPGKVSGFVNDPYNGMPGTSNLILEDSRRPDSHRSETAAYTEALFSDMMQNALTIKIPGNSNLRVGQVIDFEMQEETDTFRNKDTKFSGKNLISGITHYMGPASDAPRYVTYLDLINIQTVNSRIS